MESNTYRDGLMAACRILEFYLWFEAKKAPTTDPMWQPYLELRMLIHKTDTDNLDFQWDGNGLAK